MARYDEPTEAQYKAAVGFYNRTRALLGRSAAVLSPVAKHRLAFFPTLATQHVQGALVGDERLEDTLQAIRRAAAWAGMPPDLGSAFVGMAAEALLDCPPPFDRQLPKQPRHVMMSGGACVEQFMFDEQGVQVCSQDEAALKAQELLLSLGNLVRDVEIGTLKNWHREWRQVNGLPPLRPGRKPKGP